MSLQYKISHNTSFYVFYFIHELILKKYVTIIIHLYNTRVHNIPEPKRRYFVKPIKRRDINWMVTTTVKENLIPATATIQKTTRPIRAKDMKPKRNQTMTSSLNESCTSTNIVPISYSQPSRKNS